MGATKPFVLGARQTITVRTTAQTQASPPPRHGPRARPALLLWWSLWCCCWRVVGWQVFSFGGSLSPGPLEAADTKSSVKKGGTIPLTDPRSCEEVLVVVV